MKVLIIIIIYFIYNTPKNEISARFTDVLGREKPTQLLLVGTVATGKAAAGEGASRSPAVLAQPHTSGLSQPGTICIRKAPSPLKAPAIVPSQGPPRGKHKNAGWKPWWRMKGQKWQLSQTPGAEAGPHGEPAKISAAFF